MKALVQYFDEFDRQYPGSGFVYTHRETEAWIDSRMRHVERNQRSRAAGRYEGAFLEVEPEAWRAHQQAHRERVEAYFDRRSGDLLVMDLCGGEGWEKLCPFLGVAAPDRPFPWVGKGS